MVDWSQLCTQQSNRPLWQLQQANYGGCIFAMVSFAGCALFSGLWFRRWAKIYTKNFGLSGEERIWPGLGWFSGLMCVGSVAGAVAWASSMQANNFDYEPVMFQQLDSQYASISRWGAAFNILYGLEFMCFIVPKLMMLGRLTENSSGSSQAQAADMDRVRHRWHGGTDGMSLKRRALPMLFRAMAAAVVLCSVTGMVALYRAGAYEVQAAGVYDKAAAAACDTANNATVTCNHFIKEATAFRDNAATAASVQSVCEAVALMITAVAYLLLVLRNVAVYRRAEEVSTLALLSFGDRKDCTVEVSAVFAEADYTGAADATVQLQTASAVEIAEGTHKAAVEQRRRLVAACAVVLVSFPARAAFDLLNAYSLFSAPMDPACGQCDPCQSEQFLVSIWFNYSPEFQPIVVALSSPIPLACSLWLMMSAWERRHMRRGVDMNKTEEQRQAIAARARLGVDFPRPVISVLRP